MKKCRVCDHSLESFMTFGKMPIANGFLPREEVAKEYFFELAVGVCSECWMFQLIDQPDPKMMFHENYAFFSGTSVKMGEHFARFADSVIRDYLPEPSKSFVVELGSNDGILLKNFAKRGIPHLGCEPSANVAEAARKAGVQTLCSFFGEATANEIQRVHGQADVIMAANVVCHIPDINSLAKGVSSLLKPQGVFVYEDPYLGDVIEKTSYDQIYDEHVFLFSARSVAAAFGRQGLELFHVERQTTHGGSMRYFLCKKGARPQTNAVREQLAFEEKLGLTKLQTYLAFKESCERSKAELSGLLKDLKSKGKRVVGYAATSKSTTVLNYCGIGSDLIEFISDTTPIKQGKLSPGMHIPVKAYPEFKNRYPDFAVLFAWNHAQEVFEKEKDFARAGGQWILFVPKVHTFS